MNRIKPEKVGGFLDYLPPVMIARQEMIRKIEGVYQRFGFDPLDTPAVERLDVLTGNKKAFDMSLYRTLVVSGLDNISDAAKKCDIDLALRFDLTVPLSRVVSAYPQDIKKPFKRYQIGKVWRGEKAQAGRFREFVQFDADIIGSKSILADTEIVEIMFRVMTALGFSDFLVKFNNRKIFEALNQVVDLEDPEKRDELIRIIDKKEKISLEELTQELARPPCNKWDPAPNLSPENVDKILSFITIDGCCDEVLLKAEEVVRGVQIGEDGIVELSMMADNLKAIGIPSGNWKVDLSVARGLGYYTGPVFETVLTALPEIGSVYSGGRFDGLTDRFIPGSNIPGTGASVGVDRLFSAMLQLEKLRLKGSLVDVLIATIDPDLVPEYFRIASQLRSEGINTEVYLGESSLKKQIIYAAQKEVPLVIILGAEEQKGGQVSLRDMKNRSQEAIDKSLLVSRIKAVLK